MRIESVEPAPARDRPLRHLVLLAATVVTTTVAGARIAGVEPKSLITWAAGLPFSVTLLAILLTHEAGHYLMCRRHGIAASLPYVLPAPPFFLLGTFGAVIRVRSRFPDRRALFDMGAAGPWAGFAIALPAMVLGLRLSSIDSSPPHGPAMMLGDSLLTSTLIRLVLHTDPDTVVLHPVAFAAWAGLLVTSLNLLPVGQLDGGHVLYAARGRRAVLVPGHARCHAALALRHRLAVLDPVDRGCRRHAGDGTPTHHERRPAPGRRPPGRVIGQPAALPGHLRPRTHPDPAMRERPTWHQYFMTITRQVAERSTCLRAKVGAVIVRDKNILATGYNGSPAGLPHCLDVGCLIYRSTTPSGEIEENCFRTIHAEINAIAQAAKNGAVIRDADIYITHTPCIHCFKVLINTGIKRIFYEKPYKLHTIEEMLGYTDVTLEEIVP